MATETLTPTSLVSQTTFNEADVSNIDDDPDSPDANWALIGSNNANGDLRVGFDSPTGNPSGTQEIKAQFRQQSAGQNGTPTARIEVWETGGGAAIAASADIDITSESSQVISLTWDASALTTADGSLVEVNLVVTKAGGSPSNRESLDIGALKWVVEYSTAPESARRIFIC